ncbi:MAG: hypothetical protein IJC53_00685 [Clostridia bacterium]|nr:hypothetical protein [Clostridia bacterium]
MLKRITMCLLAVMMVLSLVACGTSESKVDNSSTPTPEDFDMPADFDIIAEETLLDIPEKSTLDDIIDTALDTIGVERVEYRAYGNYLDFTALFMDIFVVTDNNKLLMVNAFFNPSSEKWNIQSISDVNDDRYYYVRPDAAATVDVYDYKTGELVSKQSMTQEEFDEELKKQREEAEKKYQEEIDKLLENYYGQKTSATSDIAVRFETDYIDGDRLHITVFTKNNSEEVFAGNVYVTFYSADGKDRLGSDTIIVDALLPGRENWADVIVDAYRGTPKMTVDYSEVSFTPISEVIAEVDSAVTKKIKNNYDFNFLGVSWHKDITDIVAYKNGTCVVVLKNNPKENGQFYASTIWSCGNDHGVDTVQVVDAKGTIIAVYGNGEMVSVSVRNGVIVSESNTSTEVQETKATESQTTPSSHSWNSGKTTKKATCSETGIKTYTCLKCSEQKTERIPKTSHIYDGGKVIKKPTCADVGKITYTCSVCKAQYSEDIDKTAHKWDDGKVKNAATCTLEGIKEYHCTVCGSAKTESIPLIAHSFTSQIVDDKYLCKNATFTSGTKYYYSCFCGAKGSKTFSLDNRRTWISWYELVTDYNYTISYLDNNMSEKPYIKIWNKQIQFIIDNVPRGFDITTEDVYIGNCNGCSIQFKYDETQYNIRYSNQDCYFFYYDDLVAAGII